MMEIELKLGNTPKSPGFYWFKYPYHRIPRIADVRLSNGELEALSTGGFFNLADCENGVFWSDRIDIILTDGQQK